MELSENLRTRISMLDVNLAQLKNRTDEFFDILENVSKKRYTLSEGLYLHVCAKNRAIDNFANNVPYEPALDKIIQREVNIYNSYLKALLSLTPSNKHL